MRLRNALIIGQMAFSLVLLIGAGLCLRSFNRLQSVDPGFDCDHLITASLDADGANLTERSGPAFYRELMDRLAAIPGVRSASFADSTPFATMGWMSGPTVDQIEGYLPHPGEAVETKVHIVGPNYFRTLGIPQTRGLVPPAQERRERNCRTD